MQDINTVRGLVYLAEREFEADIPLIASRRFFTRDARFLWSRKLMRLADDTRARIRPFCRPHPSGRYVLKKGVPISDNVTCETRQIYRMDLSRHAYGLSAPSTVLVDMMLAGIAAAVWRDPDGGMDITNYRGLPTVSAADEWLAFDEAAQKGCERMIATQERVLERLGLMRDRAETYTRFARLIDCALTPCRVRVQAASAHA